MDLESLKVSADACEESGNNKAAQLLRELSDDKAIAYLVVERHSDYNDETYYLSGSEPQKLFLDRADAVAYANLQNAIQYKSVNPCLYGYELSEVSDFSMEELNSRIREILGDPDFNMPDEEEMWSDFDPIFPEDATDEQMLKIAKLFKIEFFQIIKTKISV